MMRKSSKKNDIILRNILNIAKIKSGKDKKTGGKAGTDTRDEARDKRTKDTTDLKRWQLIESPLIYFFFSFFNSVFCCVLLCCVTNKRVNPVSAHSW